MLTDYSKQENGLAERGEEREGRLRRTVPYLGAPLSIRYKDNMDDSDKKSILLRLDRIETGELAKELAQFPTDYLYWKLIWTDSTRKHQLVLLDLATLEGRLYASYREKLSNSNKEPTVTLVRSAVESDPSYLVEKRNAIDLEAEMNEAKAMVDALEHKASILTTLGRIVHGS